MNTMALDELEPHYRMMMPDQIASLPRNPVHVVLDNIRSAFNVGSIFRTADAGAVEHLHLCGMTCHPPNQKLAKTALGAFDYVPWTYYEKPARAIEAVRDEGIHTIAVELTEDSIPHTSFTWPKPVAVVFGNEVAGVGEPVLRQCDTTVCIPMLGHKRSMNVATTFGVILFEILRQWGALPDHHSP